MLGNIEAHIMGLPKAETFISMTCVTFFTVES